MKHRVFTPDFLKLPHDRQAAILSAVVREIRLVMERTTGKEEKREVWRRIRYLRRQAKKHGIRFEF